MKRPTHNFSWLMHARTCTVYVLCRDTGGVSSLPQVRKQLGIKISMQRLWPWQVKATRQPYISQDDCSPAQSPAGLSQLCRYASIFKLALTEAFRPKYILPLLFLTQRGYERKHFCLIPPLVACVRLAERTCVCPEMDGYMKHRDI